MFVAIRWFRFNPRGVSAKVDVEVLHIHDIGEQVRCVNGVDIVVTHVGDPAAIVAGRDIISRVKLVDFVVGLDITQFKTMPEGVNSCGEILLIGGIHIGHVQVSGDPIFRIGFLSIP